jgi:hypothetical protein
MSKLRKDEMAILLGIARKEYAPRAGSLDNLFEALVKAAREKDPRARALIEEILLLGGAETGFPAR